MGKYNRQGIICDKCRKKIEQGEKYENVHWREEDGSKGRGYWEGNNYCLSCYEDMEQERKEARERAIEKQKQEAREKFEFFDNECMNELFFMGLSLAVNSFEANDYKKLKNLQKRLNSWVNRWNDEYIEERKKDLKDGLQELEKKVPEKAKLKGSQKKGRRCSHKNIHWKPDENAYCLDCGEDESSKFLNKLGIFCKKGLDDWAKEHNLINFNTLGITNKLLSNNFTSQEELKTVYQKVVKELNYLAKQKDIPLLGNDNNRERERERERERAKLQQKITNLENKLDKTPEEEVELDKLKNKLKELDKKTKNNSSPPSPIPWIIGGGCLVVALVIIVFIATRKKRTN